MILEQRGKDEGQLQLLIFYRVAIHGKKKRFTACDD